MSRVVTRLLNLIQYICLKVSFVYKVTLNAAIVLLLAILASALSVIVVPVYALPFSWFQQYQQQYQQYPPFNYNQFNSQLWQQFCSNSYIASNVPKCSGVGVGIYQVPPVIPRMALPPQLSQQQSNAVTSSQTSQCVNGECFVTTCNNFVCSSTGTPPSQTTGQFSSAITSTCINGVCETCINGQCQVSPSSTPTRH